jgi:uncharacterized membrane protein YfcA
MSFFDHIYLNYYTLATLSGGIQWLICALFILRIPNRSTAANILVQILFTGALTGFFYAFIQGYFYKTSVEDF